MSRSRRPILPPGLLARAGGGVLDGLAYLGSLGRLAAAAARALVRPAAAGPAPPLGRALVRQCDWIFAVGLPLVGLIHIGMGSFLAMQAYYGATFVDGTGPVVGVGLCRNVAPLLTGFLLAGLMAARVVWELRTRPHVELDADPDAVPDRDVAQGRAADPRPVPAPARLALVRLLAAALAGPILATWGAVVGTAVGGLIAGRLMGIPGPIFLGKMIEMLWARDVVGLVVKGATFGLLAALFACHEGLRGPADPRLLPAAVARSACLSGAAILAVNLSWYSLMYMAGPAFGPTVLTPPGR